MKPKKGVSKIDKRSYFLSGITRTGSMGMISAEIGTPVFCKLTNTNEKDK